jgi:hypothetical protein
MDPATDWVPGMVGNALDFDGIDDRILVPATPALANLGPGTWAFWMRLTVINGTVAYKSDNNTAEGWWIDAVTAQGGLGFAGVHDGTNHRRYTSMYVVGTWSHVAMTWDGTPTNAQLYVDGLPVAHDATDTMGLGSHTSDSTQPLIIGSGNAGAANTFNGTLDELRMYDRVFAPSEISQLAACR